MIPFGADLYINVVESREQHVFRKEVRGPGVRTEGGVDVTPHTQHMEITYYYYYYF